MAKTPEIDATTDANGYPTASSAEVPMDMPEFIARMCWVEEQVLDHFRITEDIYPEAFSEDLANAISEVLAKHFPGRFPQ